MAGVDPADVDALILATTTPDRTVPATSSTVQNLLGLTSCGAFDLNAACSGWVYALVNAHGLIAMGAEQGARHRDRHPRSHHRLHGPQHRDPLRKRLGRGGHRGGRRARTDAGLGPRLARRGGERPVRRGRRVPPDGGQRGVPAGRAADGGLGDERPRAAPGSTPTTSRVVVPHQANIRIIAASLDRLDIPMERASIVLDRTGNTSSASVPLALAEALDQDRVTDGDLILFVGFGAGMSAASAVIRWSPDAIRESGVNS